MSRAKEGVPAQVPSYEAFLAFYAELQEIENYYSLASIESEIGFVFFSLVASNYKLQLIDDLKVKVMAEKLTFLHELFGEIDKLRG